MGKTEAQVYQKVGLGLMTVLSEVNAAAGRAVRNWAELSVSLAH